MEGFFKFIIIVVFVVIGFVVFVAVRSSREDEVKNYFKDKEEKPTKIEENFLIRGPYFYKESGGSIYRVETDKKNVYWFRFGIFGMDVEKE